ncbi:tRNA (adenosine(37)-N6)-dimethylallyltransferase MiaA [Geitlerinema sp. PCC 7407]|uniref:tRNA (adenosine(37)-N6)-dimethylallyltransferase MiaA n=1 Tax=Geitlerinema sp. PCC 7407 TaxID=1173025 RepID=UPI00029FCD93|nr:tRNA (adenosine(37)-N6)-dimethylallyltransferase MiaA [Geitlerinema sp. PCC 7407]AFY65513.1 tRNA delta(2)-isopentenylpyrophosphate transferase [Geitlerinema sp. PCC 7407]
MKGVDYCFSRPGLIVIAGPTATGKSSLAIALAQRFQTVILSADSRQVYREFDIGTAKPSLAEQQQAPHALLDICEPTETLTLADYQQRAQQHIARCHAVGMTPLLVGGTGLYIRAVVQGLKIPRVPPQPDLRSQLMSLGQPHCYTLLQQVDPVAAARIHANDLVRTLRALEVFYVSGRTISEQQGENPPSYPILQVALDCAQPDLLARRIQQRTAQMMAGGFEAEVARLVEKYGDGLPLLDTLGYQEMRQCLRGEISRAEAEALTVLHTRQFAKRQRTWFRGDERIEWFDSDRPDLLDAICQKIQEFGAEFVDLKATSYC